MKEERFLIQNIPAVVYGEASDKCYLYVHGQSGCKEEGAVFARIACPAGYQVLAIDLPAHGQRKGKQEGFNPWTAAPEIETVFAYIEPRWSEICLRATSIGAHFSMLALSGKPLCRALFVSPVLDMERLITDMMGWAGVSERQLCERGEIATDFGQTLSWDYLSWERAHPVKSWDCPTTILYAERDTLLEYETVKCFAASHAAALTIAPGAEHWFHTPQQLETLGAWEQKYI